MRTDENRSSRPVVRRLTSMKRIALVVAAGIVLGGCGGDGGGITPPPTITIAKTAADNGNAQAGSAGQPLGSPLRVLVTSDGTPSAGATVSWSAAGGGSFLPASGVTDGNGIASSAWTLGGALGAQTAQAVVSGASGSPVSFTATAGPGPAAALTIADGDQQAGPVNEQLAAPVQAKAQDQFGNGVPDVAVSWAATGGTVSSATVPTDAGGISGVQVTLGPTAGPITITAVADGLLGSPLTFEAAALDPAIPTEATVQVGPAVFFLSLRNGSGLIRNENGLLDPAVDTVAVGGTVTWIWAPPEQGPARRHSVESRGEPSFSPNSPVLAGGGHVFTHTFTVAGTYEYKCGPHGGGPRGMSGRIVVR